MHIELDPWPVTNAAEAMDLSGLDDENVTGPCFELLSVDGPPTAPFSHKLDFIVRMTMGTRTTSGEPAEEEHGDIHIAIIGANEVVRAAPKGQIVLTNA